jgi:Brp/Blh family beta-carotene 15,15'-monooxygenase
MTRSFLAGHHHRSSPGAGWYGEKNMRAEHARGLVLVLPLALAVGLAVPSSDAMSLLLLALIALLGLPHGALALERLRLDAPGRRGRATLTYAGLAAIALLAFAVAPRLTLATLLLVSALHFGREDVGHPLDDAGRLAEACVRGSLPIVAPALVHPESVGQLLGAVEGLPPGTPSPLGGALAAAGLVLVPLAALLAVFRAARTPRELRAVPFRDAAEVALLLALFVLLPPLASFLVYFCGVHAARHTLELRLPGPARSWAEAVRRFALGLPLSLAVLAAGGAVFAVLPGPAAEAGVRVVFQGLLALTLPHVWLHARADTGDALR